MLPRFPRVQRPHAALLFLPIALLAACSDAPTEPATERQHNVSVPIVEMWWPVDSTWLQGLHLMKARLSDQRALSSYRMYWQVDGGSLTQMQNSNVDAPHKEAWVDFTNWRWNGTGPYTLNFIARDRYTGAKIAERQVRIWLGTPPATTPIAAPVRPVNPFAGAKLFVDPYSQAQAQAHAWRVSRPADAALIDRIALQPQADWIGDWLPDVQAHTADRMSLVTAADALPVFVLYNIPGRDCNMYSAGGSATADAYRAFVRAFANGIGSRRAVVIIEPDALGLLDCLTPEGQQIRLDLIRDAIEVFRSKGQIYSYIDAGNAHWQPAAVMADRLARAGIANADGFSLNISNFQTTADNAAYGASLSALVGGKHFLIDTSRNGLGPTADFQWCNPDGRALGIAPTTQTGNALIDAFLWIKRPGESDGECNGGPRAGAFWAEYALGLAQRSAVVVAAN